MTVKTKKTIGWIFTGLVSAFFLFDAFGKFVPNEAVTTAMQELGIPLRQAAVIGSILLVCTVLYVIPKTSKLGAILLTGYLGGAIATHLRLEKPLFSFTLFPSYFGFFVWLGYLLRHNLGLNYFFSNNKS